MLQDFKIDAFDKKIADLPDVPQLSAGELKACFDASPEQLRQSLNGALDALACETGAAQIGFQQSSSVHAGTVQEAIENVQGQIKNVAIGQIPEGAVSLNMLSEDVMLHLAGIEQKRLEGDSLLTAKMEEEHQTLTNSIDSVSASLNSTRTSLQNNISSLYNTVENKVSLYFGQYTGNSTTFDGTQSINLGYQPKMVFLYNQGNGVNDVFLIQGFNKITAWITSSGFAVKSTDYNNKGTVYGYVAFR